MYKTIAATVLTAVSFVSAADIITTMQHEQAIPLITELNTQISHEWAEYGNNPHTVVMSCDLYEGQTNLQSSMSSGKVTQVVIAPPDGENYSLRTGDIDIKEFDSFTKIKETFVLNKNLADGHQIQMVIDTSKLDYSVIEHNDGKTKYMRQCKPENVVKLEKQRADIVAKLVL